MWRDRLDAFWDGRRGFAIAFFEEAGAPSLRPDLTLFSARDAALSGAALVDVLDAPRLRCGYCVVELPSEHAFVSLRAADGAELRFALGDFDAEHAGGESRLLLVEAGEGEGPPAFRAVSLAARGDAERAARDQIARSGGRLVWAVRQNRRVERRDGAAALMRLAAAERIFPAQQSRIAVEAIDAPPARGPTTLMAPFAIMENWLRENGAPCPTLRLRIPNAVRGDLLFARAVVVLALHQRRRFRDWLREQRAAGEPTADPLTLADIRRAIGAPGERFEAVEASDAIIVHRLADVLAAPDGAVFDGLSATRVAEGAESGLVVDLHFFGAALGDDIGLVCTCADAGDFGVIPDDPGGAPYARLFRLDSDGAIARRIADGDRLLDEILRRAVDAERDAEGGAGRGDERAASAQGRRERLLAGFNAALALCGYGGRFSAARLWDLVDPLTMAAFVALAEDAGPDGRAAIARLGGYDAYRADPVLMEASARRAELTRGATEARYRDYCGPARPLLQRFLGLCNAKGLAAADIDPAAQLRLWALLGEPVLAQPLIAARIELVDAKEPARLAATARLLVDEAIVERAAIYCDDLQLEGEARALRDYLERRRAGRWTRIDDAARLAVMVDEANAYWRRPQAARAAPVAETRAPAPAAARPEGLLATMRSLLKRGGGKGSRP
ncbi:MULTISPECIES: hypothetical protein [Methylosinus]|uniref:Uncharacterized protein n=1 Tax=Methylosinus trichosporium (strain ATCC 35070 / NCIMB 11131 / UNIQEM 75 / OB3b) TaxID=595536 RepID=A0A2D2D3H5_METT3|nr:MULTISPECIES: hypothetical protein [Methylosinus]ATQ69548.1 hypothetical protein CQW49_17935 [Methylosinus trichosporium OB3b]OBS50491.1 hypothetical protein A8B73_21265 [Methylosinus sp. 3S-1]